jgi:hypothetical protein
MLNAKFLEAITNFEKQPTASKFGIVQAFAGVDAEGLEKLGGTSLYGRPGPNDLTHVRETLGINYRGWPAVVEAYRREFPAAFPKDK